MKNLSFNYCLCDDILSYFGEEKVERYYNTIYDELIEFISINKLSDLIRVDKVLLGNVIIDYFNDIKRLMEFHKDIKNVNSEKVIAYTSYWLLHRKPLQIIKEDFNCKEIQTINERFVLQYILNYLSVRERKSHILLRKNKGLQNFASLMLYYLVYRKYDAQSLEMIVTAFLAGQIYEQIGEDISNKLHPFDV